MWPSFQLKTSPCNFFAGLLFVFKILVCKNLYLLSCQQVTAKTVISLKIPRNIDLLQRATLKKCWFEVKTIRILISHQRAAAKTLISLKLQANVNFTQCASFRQRWFQVIYRQLKFWLHSITPPKDFNFTKRTVKSSFHATCKLSWKATCKNVR